MNRNITKKLAGFGKSVFSLTLLLCLLFATSGVFYTIHFCHGNATGLRFFNRIEVKGTCGCHAESFDPQGYLKTIAAESCCVEFDHYAKSDLQYVKFSQEKLQILLPSSEAVTDQFADNTDFTKKELLYLNKPPPINPTGKQIVISLHSLRIPLS